MRNRTRRLLSIFLAAAMLTGQGNMAAFAESATEAVAVAAEAPAEEPAPVTEAPAPATEAPVTEPPAPVTEAPATEAPAPVTEAPETEAPAPVTEAPETEAPAEETVPETEAPDTEAAETETVTETSTEAAEKTETEQAEEKKTDTFTWKTDALTVTVKLSEKDKLPESAKLEVKELTEKTAKKEYGSAVALLKKETDKGHRAMTQVKVYQLSFTADGKDFVPSEQVKVTFEYKKGLSLGLSKYAQAEAKAFVLTEKQAKECEELTLKEDTKVTKAEVSAKDSLLVGIVGIQNRSNDGEVITAESLEKHLKEVQDYAVVANEYIGGQEDGVWTSETEDSEEKETPKEWLKNLSEYSLLLANGKSSDSVTVINLYAEEDGTINEEPLEEFLEEDVIDVTDSILVVNIVAAEADQKLELPVYTVEDQDKTVDAENSDSAGHILYNLTAEENEKLTAYEGEASLKAKNVGIYLIPEGSLTAEKMLVGAAYADKVTAEDVKPAEKETEAAETETETAAAETETETAAETETETAAAETETETTAAETETETAAAETETETTAAETETETTAAETETETTAAETETETTAAETETETAAETETETAAAETETEEAETETEQALIEETELESEMVMEEEEELAVQTLAAEGAKAASLPVKKVTKAVETGDTVTKEQPLAGAKLVVSAADDVVALAEITIKDKDGKDKKFAKGATVYTQGTEIYSWTTDAKGTAVDLASYLVPGGSYLLRETVTPEGYMKSNDISFQLDAKGNAKYPTGDSETLKELIVVNYPVPSSEDETQSGMLFLKLAVQEGQKGAGETGKAPVYLDGAEFVIKDEDGKPLTDGNGSLYTFSTEAKVMTLNLDPAIYQALTDKLENGGQKTFTIAQIKAKSGYQVSGYAEAELVVQKDDTGNVTLVPQEEAVNTDGVLIFYNTKITGSAAGSIKVTKRNYLGKTDNQIYSKTGGVYYAALFADEEKTDRVSDVKQIKIKTGYKSASVIFENLANGTYYVGETDAYGNLVGEDSDEKTATDLFYAEYAYGANRKNITIKVDDDAEFDADAENVTIANRYFKMPEGFVYTAAFQTTLKLKNESGAAYNSQSTYYANIYTKSTQNGKYSYIGKKAIKMGGKSEKTIIVELTMSTQTKYIKVKVTDAKGNAVGNEKELVLKQGDTKIQNAVIEAVIASSENETESETQTTVDPNNMKAELKLTKKVTYKNTPIRVNQIYYIGIFDDAELTKLRYKKAMTFTNASELTATLKVNLHKLASKEVTFYFAEVDEEGKLVKSGKEFGYDISINKKSITLNADNMADELIVTNNVYEGGSVAQQLTDPSSGLAGDSAALAEAQNLASSGNSSENTQTGDDNPILPLIIVLAVSVAVIIAVVVFLITRNRKQRRDHRRR